MRIPWFVSFFLIVGLVAGLWHWRTRDLNFMEPKGVVLGPEDMGQNLATGVPHFGDSPAPPLAAEASPTPGADPGAPSGSGQSTKPVLALGDLEAAPGLYEYLEQAQNGADYLFELAGALQNEGEFQRSLLALERVIDATEATPEQIAQAAKGIAAIAPTLPAWNVDPSAMVPIKFSIGSARATSENLKAATLDIATEIHRQSGEQLDIIPVISGGSANNLIPNGPIAIWLSSTGEMPASTAVLSITPDDEEMDTLTEELALTTYRLVRSYLGRIGYSTDSPPQGVDGRELLRTHITRRMWYDFAQTLINEEEANIEAAKQQAEEGSPAPRSPAAAQPVEE